MKKWIYIVLMAMLVMNLTIGASLVYAAGLPESVQKQSRKDVKESEEWKKLDTSGPVKFLQVEDTAAASTPETAAKLDGSIGERLIEVKIDPSVAVETMTWTFENKGPGNVWVVASSDGEMETAIEVKAEGTAELETQVVDGYGYVVVDSDGKGETSLTIKAKVGESEAKTARGKNMNVSWF